jgi:hypothetical protein
VAVDMPLDERGLGKIIEAVGRRYIPATLDRSALRRAIDKSKKSAETISKNRHGARARKRFERLKQILEAAKRLASLLEVTDDASDMVQRLCGEWTLAMVSRLIVDIEALVHVLSDGDREPSQWGNPTTNEWLAGAELPCVFEEHFCRKPGASWNKAHKKAGGPCVRFIEATMLELGKPYSTASILRAMTRLRALRKSRRLVRAKRGSWASMMASSPLSRATASSA